MFFLVAATVSPIGGGGGVNMDSSLLSLGECEEAGFAETVENLPLPGAAHDRKEKKKKRRRREEEKVVVEEEEEEPVNIARREEEVKEREKRKKIGSLHGFFFVSLAISLSAGGKEVA